VFGGAGADTITLSTGSDVVRFGEDESVAPTAIYDVSTSTTTAVTSTTGAVPFAAGDIITFGNGVDTISGFTIGTDDLNMNGFAIAASTIIPVALIDVTMTQLTASKLLFTAGTWSSSAGTFTISTTGADTILVVNDSTSVATSLTSTNWVVLVGALTPTNVDLVSGLVGGA